MTTGSPLWWNDPDELYTVLRDLLQHLRRRASTFDERTEGWLLLSGMHLDAGPWRYVRDVDVVGELPFETGLVLVNEMLARLQELSWEPGARDSIGHVHHRLNEICDPHELEWLRPREGPTDPRSDVLQRVRNPAPRKTAPSVQKPAARMLRRFVDRSAHPGGPSAISGVCDEW